MGASLTDRSVVFRDMVGARVKFSARSEGRIGAKVFYHVAFQCHASVCKSANAQRLSTPHLRSFTRKYTQYEDSRQTDTQVLEEEFVLRFRKEVIDAQIGATATSSAAAPCRTKS